MRRLFYLALGAGLGVAAVRKVSRVAAKAAQRLTPTNMAGSARASASGMFDSARAFIDEVRFGMAEREIELRDALTGGDEPSKRGR